MNALPIGERMARALWDFRDAMLRTRNEVRRFSDAWFAGLERDMLHARTRHAVALQRRRRK